MEFGTFTIGENVDSKFWLMLSPLIVLQLVLWIIAFVDIARRTRFRFGNKWIWSLIVIFGNILGPVAYFLLRGEEE
ncbi:MULTISPECIES: PLD nuclease N-terminal domain-containing protein [Paenibacillus]|uniref:PLD nuclease N-terminal domain-containing protein n=1 Tax=Paenibacillus TaxID=44249 RepID=UPI001EE8BA72|nr:PLD nuclease N-terminal domain-containing protein [Paenibacillus piscarius]